MKRSYLSLSANIAINDLDQSFRYNYNFIQQWQSVIEITS